MGLNVFRHPPARVKFRGNWWYYTGRTASLYDETRQASFDVAEYEFDDGARRWLTRDGIEVDIGWYDEDVYEAQETRGLL